MCASSCKTQDHATFGECIRAQNQKVGYCRSSFGQDSSRQKQWDRDIQAFRDATRQGIHPDTTKRADVDRAVKESNETGKAYVAW